MSNTLKFGDGKWAVKQGSTLAYNDENGNFKPLPFEFNRSTSATRVNKQGLIELVSNNEPRIDFLNDSKGALLLEPARTNLIPYSEDFNGTGWTVFAASGGTCTRTLNYGISPQGIQNSTRVVFSGNNTALYFNVSIYVASTATIYVKGVAGEIIGFGFGGLVSDGIDFTFNGEWQRLVFSGSSGGLVTINTWSATRNARNFEIYGAQLEDGSYATSYIPTQGAISTRVAETCNGAGNAQVFNGSEGVLFAEVSTFADNTYKRISLSDGSYVNSVVFDFVDDNNLYGKIFAGGNPIATILASGLNIENNNKLAFKYKQNDFALWVNGIQVGVDTSGLTPSGLNTLSLDLGGNENFYGNTKQIKYFNKALSDTELAALTKI